MSKPNLPMTLLNATYAQSTGLPFLTNASISSSNTDNTSAIQALINALAASSTQTVGMLPAGNLIVNGTLTWPLGKPISLRGQGSGGAGGITGTQLTRTSGTQPLIQFTGTADDSNHRVLVDLRDMQIFGSDLGGVLVQIQRAYHSQLNNVRIAHNEGGIGLQCTNWNDSLSSGSLIVEYCGGTGSFTGSTNATTTISGVSNFTNIMQGTILSGSGIGSGTTVISTNPGAGTILVDRTTSATASGITIGYINPAHIWDSTPGDAGGNTATAYIAEAKYQLNYGTDLRITGSIPDNQPATDVKYGLLSMEGVGAGTAGSPDTYPFIDLDYADYCHFPSVRISMPTGRACIAMVQQNGASAGTRANIFGILSCDIAGTSQPTNIVDIGVGAMTINSLVAGASTLWASSLILIRGSVGAGRFKVTSISHNSPAPYAGFITDQRTIAENISKGRINVPFITGGSTTTGTIGNAAYQSYPTGSTAFRVGQVALPEDADPNGQCRLRLYWTCATGDATKNVYWSWLSGVYAAGAAVNAGTATYDNIVANTATANAMMVTTWSTGPTSAPGGLLDVYVARLGGNASDTLAQAVLLIGAEIIYDRRF